MKGARKYAEMFKTKQYGRLYLVSGEHARGKTFRIQVLPKGEKALPNGHNNECLNVDAVKVYGIVNGNPGWTEEYGWIHKGAWQSDFEKLVKDTQKNIDQKKAIYEENSKQRKQHEQKRVANLLSDY